MPTTLGDLALPALWTFQRDEETLTILREVIDGRPTLTISDRRGTNAVPFDDVVALTVFQADVERRLIDEGWALAAFAPDLRAGQERRRATRAGANRRRPW